MDLPIFDFNVAFFIITVFFQLIVLLILYWMISGHSYRHPWKIFVYGVACMFFAGFQKSLLLKMASGLQSKDPKIVEFIASLPMSITVVEIATAAVGGSLVAASFILKSQILHNKNKILKESRVQELIKSSTKLEAEIDFQSRLLKMESLGYIEFNKAIRSMKKDLGKLKEDRLRVESQLINAQESFDELKYI